MALTESQVWAAAKIDHMPRFKELVDALAPDDLDELARRFSGFRRYAAVLEALAGGIQSGAIEVPR